MSKHRLTIKTVFPAASSSLRLTRSLGASLFMLASVSSALVLTSACATTRSASAQIDDASLANSVGRKLTADDVVQRSKIDVDALNGEVTLRGEVASHVIRDRATYVAQRTEGVHQVHNKLTINPELVEPESDGTITARVKTRLGADPEVRAVNIDVDTHDGVVTLSGIVESEVAKQEALELALRTEGVLRVVSELKVAS